MTFEQGGHDGVSSLEPLLKVFADSDRLGVVMKLLQGPSTQKELSTLLEISSGTVSKHMSVLEEAKLVVRERSHSPYSLVAPTETIDLLRAAARLSVAATGAHLDTSMALQEHLEILGSSQDQQ